MAAVITLVPPVVSAPTRDPDGRARASKTSRMARAMLVTAVSCTRTWRKVVPESGPRACSTSAPKRAEVGVSSRATQAAGLARIARVGA